MKIRIKMGIIGMVLATLAIQPEIVNAQYCTVSAYVPCSYYNTYINSFVTTGGTTNISNTNSGCNNSSTSYTYFNTMKHTGARSASVGFTIGNNPSYPLGYAMYVDFNNDGDFVDAGEQVYSGSLGGGSSVTSTFTIPSGATVGTTRLRLISDYYGSPSSCGPIYYGECEDYAFEIIIPCVAAITTQPVDTAVCTGNNGSFSVAATNANNYQWQVSTNGGGSWSNISNGGVYSGVTTSSLLLTAPPITMTTYKYRCVATNTASSCSISSTAGTLTVNQTPFIATTTPGFACLNGAGQVGATGSTGVTVRWWSQSSGGTMLGTGNTYNIASASGNTNYYAEPYISGVPQAGSLTTTAANNGNAVSTFDCKPLTNMTVTGFDFTPRATTTYTASIYYKTGTMVGSTSTSGAWTLLGTSSSFSATTNVSTAIPITLSLNLSANTTYAFYIYVTGGTLGYTNGTGVVGTLWASNSDLQVYEGYGSGSLFSTSLNTTRTFSGTIHYTKTVAPPCTNTSRTAVALSVDAAPVISAHPSNVTICNNLNTTFSVTATNVASYQWEVSTNGGATWSTVNNGGVYSNATTATLGLTAVTTTLSANQYRCKLTTPCSIVSNSNAATLTVNPPASVTANPANTTICTGANASFSCTATGFGTLAYQWEESTNGGATWAAITNGGAYSGATTSALGISAVTSTFNTYQYRCVVTGTCAPAATTTAAILTVNTPPNITTHPASQTVCPETNVTFTCAAVGGTFTYQWQEFTSSWSNITNGGIYAGATTPSLVLNGVTSAFNNNKYRCLVTGNCTPPDTTNEATLAINPVPNISGTSNSPVCEGDDLNLNASSSTSGITFGWTGPLGYNTTTQNPTIPNPTVANSGDYVITATITATGCTASDVVSAVVKVRPVVPTLTNNSPVCTFSDIDLTATSTAGATFRWTGPGGFTSNQQNPTRPNATFAMGGYYVADATISGCTSAKDSTQVVIIPSPEVAAYPSPGTTVCDGDTIRFFGLSANTGVGPTYQWMKNGVAIPGETTLKYLGVGLVTGDQVSLRMTPGTGVSCNSDVNSAIIPVTIDPYLAPQVSITIDPVTPVWQGLLVTFTATATDAGKHPKYQWKKNGQDIQGANGDTWSTTSFEDKDVISCEIISDYICAQPLANQSNQISIPVLTSVSKTGTHTNVSLYPNPNKGSFTLKGKTAAGKVQLEILNALGQVVYKNEITTDGNLQQEIQLSNMADGVYLLRMNGDNSQNSIRFRIAN